MYKCCIRSCLATDECVLKLFKPITESQKETKESLVQELKPIQEGLKELPAIAYPPQLQAIAPPPEGDEDEDEEGVMQVGRIAHRYLSDYAAKQNVDKTFGIYKNPVDKQYYIGNQPIDIEGNNLIVGEKEYEGTPGLWELIISKQPDEGIYTRTDFDNYTMLLLETSALKQNNHPEETRPKSSRGWKWRHLLRDIWINRREFEGQGTVVIPSDPVALTERLKLLLASKAAGNTGVRNELVSICDELLRQKKISKTLYKKLALL